MVAPMGVQQMGILHFSGKHRFVIHVDRTVLLERPLRLAVLQCRVSEPLMRFGQLQLQPMARQDGNECKSRGRENDGVASEGQGKGEGNTVRAHARAKLEMWV